MHSADARGDWEAPNEHNEICENRGGGGKRKDHHGMS